MSRLYRGAVIIVLSLLLGACGTDDGYVLGDEEFDPPAGFLRVVNLMPDSPALAILIDDQPFRAGVQRLPPLNFGSSLPFVQVLPQITLRFSIQYSLDNEAVPLITDAPLFIDIDHDATVLLAGTLDNPAMVTIDNPPLTETGDEDSLELQFAHVATSTDVPVDITLVQGTETVQQFTLDFSEFTDRIDFAPGDYEIIVTENGTGNELWRSGTFSLSAAVRGLVVLADYFGPGANSVRMLTVGEQLTTTFASEQLPAALRIANMTPDQGPLDIYLNDALFAENVAFTDVTAYLDAPLGNVDISVTPFGDPASQLSLTEDQRITSGNFHTLAITGLAETSNAQIYLDDARRVPVRALFNVTNASLSSGSLDVYIAEPGTTPADVSPTTQVSQVPLTNSSKGIRLQAGIYDLYLTTTGEDEDVLYGPQRIDIAGGGIYSIFIADSAGGGEPLQVIFTDDFD